MYPESISISLAISLTVSETLYSDNPLKDSQTKLDLLDDLCKALVRPNGALRYQGDEYLNLDYHKLTNESAKKESKEAEWFLVSEISSAYGTIVKNLLSYIEEHGTDEKSIKLLKQAFEKQTEHINRSYARITPKNMTKSNGYSCPAYKVPEAYEAVTTSKGIKYVPGAHPLTWAESSLMKASEIFEENLRKIDELGLNI